MAANLFLFSVTVLVWSSTWLVITFQLTQVPPVLSVAFRFAIASTLLFGYCLAFGKRLRFPARDHVFLAGYGILCFGVCYVLAYKASGLITSGLLAVIFSLLLAFNIINLRLFLGQDIRARAVWGGLAGLTGLMFIFHKEIADFSLSAGMSGLLLGAAGAYSASLSNVIATRNYRAGIGPAQASAWGMAYGAAATFIFHLAQGGQVVIDLGISYLWPLLYLALLGSVVTFVCYLTLIQRIGADYAAYTSTISPVLALGLSTIFEGYQWTAPAAAGVGLVVLGNIIILTPTRRLRRLLGLKPVPAAPVR